MDRGREGKAGTVSLSPLRMISEEVARFSTMTPEQVYDSLESLLRRLRDESWDLLQSNPNSDNALRSSLVYQALSESLVSFGSTLLAMEHILIQNSVKASS